MGELKPEREAVWAKIDANPNWLPFAFEFDAPASAKGARDLWLRELEKTDVTVVLLWKTLGAWTKDEFDLSRNLGIPVLFFIKLDETSPLRDSQSAFVADLENPETLGTPKYFTSLEDLNESVSQSIQTALHDIVRDRKLSPEGETLGNMRVGTPTDHGFSVKEAPGPKISPRDSGDRRRLRKNPRRRRFVGRVQEKRTLMLDIDSGDPLVVIVGPPGIGKKALLRELTWKEDLDPDFEDGAAVHPHYADTANLEDLLQAIWEEFYETDDPGVVLPSRRIRDLVRVSAGCDGGEEVPVGLPGVEQRPDPVVAEPSKPERDPFDTFDQVVDGFGGSVGDVASMPGHDLVLPPQQRAAERVDLRWTRVVLEIPAEPVDEHLGEVRIGVGIYLADHLFGVPRRFHLTPGVPSSQQTQQFAATPVVEPFVGFGQQPSDPIQRIVLAAPMPQRFVLDPSPGFVELLEFANFMR